MSLALRRLSHRICTGTDGFQASASASVASGTALRQFFISHRGPPPLVSDSEERVNVSCLFAVSDLGGNRLARSELFGCAAQGSKRKCKSSQAEKFGALPFPTEVAQGLAASAHQPSSTCSYSLCEPHVMRRYNSTAPKMHSRLIEAEAC